ncbi:MAG: MBL fold metallo-hydrolase [Verrucomicrobiota bacterium]
MAQVPASAPWGETLAEHARLIGQLAAGIRGEALRRNAAAPALTRLVAGLAGSGALELGAAPTKRLAPPRGTVMHLGHATLLANLDDHFLLIDPWLPPASRSDVLPPPAPAALPPLAGILITHHHWDHVHLETLLKLDKEVPVHIPRQPEGLTLTPRTDLLLRYLGFQRVIPLGHGEQLRFGATGVVVAAPFYGEDPVGLGYGGNCYLLCQDGRAALVHVDSGTDSVGRSLVTTGEARQLVMHHGPLSPIFATRRQRKGTHDRTYLRVPVPAGRALVAAHRELLQRWQFFSRAVS